MAYQKTKSLGKLIDELPWQAKKEAENFILFLKQKYSSEKIEKTVSKPKAQNLFEGWEGALKDSKNQIDPVELQHETQNLWIENVSAGHKHHN